MNWPGAGGLGTGGLQVFAVCALLLYSSSIFYIFEWLGSIQMLGEFTLREIQIPSLP